MSSHIDNNFKHALVRGTLILAFPFLEVFWRAQNKGLVAFQTVSCLCDVWPDYDHKNVQNSPENRSVPRQFQEEAPAHADLRWQQHGQTRKEDIFLHLEGNSDQPINYNARLIDSVGKS